MDYSVNGDGEMGSNMGKMLALHITAETKLNSKQIYDDCGSSHL